MIAVKVWYPGSSDLQEQDTILRLQQCTLSGNTASDVLVSLGGDYPFTWLEAEIYSDDERGVYYQKDTDSIGTSLPLSQAPANRSGINASSA